MKREMRPEGLTESRFVCPYRLLIKAKLFSRSRSEEFMDCYGKRCPYYEEYDNRAYCNKAEKETA